MAQATKNGSRASSAKRPSRGAKSNGASGTQVTSPRKADAESPALAKKAKVPAIASGAALAGLAGGIALSARRDGSRNVLGLKLPARSRTQMATKHLADAAKHLGTLGDQVAQAATEVRKVREGFEARESRSPIEVVLQGLTRRGER